MLKSLVHVNRLPLDLSTQHTLTEIIFFAQIDKLVELFFCEDETKQQQQVFTAIQTKRPKGYISKWQFICHKQDHS